MSAYSKGVRNLAVSVYDLIPNTGIDLSRDTVLPQ
jgi:hypothetical protein